MIRIKGLLLGLGVAALTVIGVACGSGVASTPAPTETSAASVSPPAEARSTGGQSGPAMLSMLPRPKSVKELVAGAHVIVLGTVASVLEEKMIGPYGEDGQPLPADDSGLPFADYDLQIESVLKGDGTVADGGSLVLRMFGHLSDQSGAVTSGVFTLPAQGDRLMFALGKNPDGTYGSGPEGLLRVDGEKVVYIDGVPFAAGISPEQFTRDIIDATPGPAALEESLAPSDALSGTPLAASTRPSHGTPPPQASSPGPSLMFEGVEYVHAGYAEPADEAQAFFIDGREVYVDNLEVVGRTTEGNTPGIRDGLQVYRDKGGETNEVYTFRQGKDHVNPEDGQIFKGRDGWTYWTPTKLTEPSQNG